MFYPSRRFSGFPGRLRLAITEQGRSCSARVFSWFRRTCHTAFGYVFYNDMNMKPVAQRGGQRTMLPGPAVYGLLSHFNAAIVVNFTMPDGIGYTLPTEFEVRYV
ncbi:acid stress response protein YqgB [Atlantibacter subterraneus]